MSVYLQQIEQLVALQRVDDAIYTITQELELAPQELSSLEKRFAISEEQRNRVLEKLEHIHDQQKRLASEIEDDSTRIKKSRSKLMQVENQKEYSAVMREMDNMEKQNRSREEEKLALAEELQLQNDALAEIDLSYLSLKSELEVKRENLQERIDTASAKLEELEKNRLSTGSIIPEPIFQRYEFIRKRLDHPVIVSVNNGICNGCHISIPPQAFVELQRGQQILSCTNCQRLVYWCEHFTNPDENKIREELPIEKPKIVTFLND